MESPSLAICSWADRLFSLPPHFSNILFKIGETVSSSTHLLSGPTRCLARSCCAGLLIALCSLIRTDFCKLAVSLQILNWKLRGAERSFPFPHSGVRGPLPVPWHLTLYYVSCTITSQPCCLLTFETDTLWSGVIPTCCKLIHGNEVALPTVCGPRRCPGDARRCTQRRFLSPWS